MIAVSHPGRIGDALYALPAAQALSEKYKCQCDFYTSDWCLPLKSLLEHQPCIHSMIVPKEYVIGAHTIGVQPWKMPIPESRYQHVAQLGYKMYPTRFLAEHICRDAGVKFTGLSLECPDLPSEKPYLAICSRTLGDFRHYFYKTPDVLNEIIETNNVIIVGLHPLAKPYPEIEVVKEDLLRMASLIKGCSGFIGQPSGMHTIATFFDIRRVVLTAPFTDPRHLYKTENDLFIPCPETDAKTILDWLQR